MNLLAITVACLLLGLVSCQFNCPLPTNSELENAFGLVIRSDDNPEQPQITLLNVQYVCRAFSRERDRYRYVSVLAEYMCEGNTLCPDDTVTEQLDILCFNGTWSQGNMIFSIRTQSPTATFSTELREDCVFCVSPAADGLLPINAPDEDNHCTREEHYSCSNSIDQC